MRLRISMAVVGATAIVLALAGPAAAHVSLHPDTAAPGATSTVLAFRVPNERADGATVGLRVQFPRDHPIVSATVRATPGWTATITRMPIDKPVMLEGEPVNQAIDQIEWKGGTIAVGEYQDFEVNVGPMPDGAATLVFPAIQVYDKGEPVSWIAKPNPGGAAPDHPAPTLTVSAAAGPAVALASSAAPAPTPATTESTGSDGSTRALAIVALALAIVALITANRRRPATAAAAAPDEGPAAGG